MTTDITTCGPGITPALVAKREADTSLYDHCVACASCLTGALCPGGERLNDACDAALAALRREIGR